MATSESLKNQLVKNENKPPKNPFKALVYSAGIKKRFEDMLDKQANGFITSLLNLKQDKLKNCDDFTVLESALKAATLKLPIDPNLGFAWIIPFKNHGKLEVQFQIGYKGFIQMAQRSGQYKKLNVTEIYEGQLKSFNPLTEEIELDLNDNNVNNDNKYSSNSNEFRLFQYLFNHIKENRPNVKEPNFETWFRHFDYILRIDKREIEEVKAVIKWCQHDSFWYMNILSPDKLRKKYDTLVLQMNDPKKSVNSKQGKVTNFANYPDQRQYYFNDLEDKLLNKAVIPKSNDGDSEYDELLKKLIGK